MIKKLMQQIKQILSRKKVKNSVISDEGKSMTYDNPLPHDYQHESSYSGWSNYYTDPDIEVMTMTVTRKFSMCNHPHVKKAIEKSVGKIGPYTTVIVNEDEFYLLENDRLN